MFMDKEDENIFSKIAKEAKSFLGLQLDEGVSSSYANKEDTARVKYGLNKLGYYDEPEKTGMNTIPDKQMFDGVKDFQKDNGLQVDGYLKPLGETINKINEGLREGFKMVKESALAGYDMTKNYVDMRIAYNKKGDDYFHCKANYDATKRGKYGEMFAEKVGDTKEYYDYFKNQHIKGFSEQEAFDDFVHDTSVNRDGRHLAKSGLYSSSKEGCNKYRVNGISARY
jgi:hypothetical protein